MSPDECAYAFFTVVEDPPIANRLTRTYTILNNRTRAALGSIAWYGPWRGFCFFPATGTVFSSGCLKDLQSAIAWAGQRRLAARRRP